MGGWWESLGLRGPLDLSGDISERVLREYQPVGFAPVGNDGEVLSLEQVVGLIEAAAGEAKSRRERAVAERRTADVAEFEAAFELSGSDTIVEHGRWAGFTRGEATAWCWNLFQYEPHGFVHPGSQVRGEALINLRAGGLPEVFGYPERARELTNTGLTPRQYRQHREALGAKTFDPADVRHT